MKHPRSLAKIKWRTPCVYRHIRLFAHKPNGVRGRDDGGRDIGGIERWENVKTDSTWPSPRSDEGISNTVRKAMRNLPHSVAVVTSLADSPSLQQCSSIDPTTDHTELLSPYYQDFCGATISSLQTVTLGPPAIISFNLKMPSRTLSGLLHHKQFGVHLLKADRQGSEIADTFIQQRHREAFRLLSQNGRWVGLGLGPLERVEDLEKRVPLIRGGGVFSFMRCEVLSDKSVQVGDHMLVIAKVASIGLRVSDAQMPYQSTLAYVHGDYHGVNMGTQLGKGPELSEIPCIRINSLRVHNDVLGLSTFSMEHTLAQFCHKVRRELPAELQDEVDKYLVQDMRWTTKALIVQRAKESHARSESPKLETRYRVEEKLLYASFQARRPWNFWGHHLDDWPSTSPPWADGNEVAVVPDKSGKYVLFGRVRTQRVKNVHVPSQIGEQALPTIENPPNRGSNPSGATGGEEEDDDSSVHDTSQNRQESLPTMDSTANQGSDPLGVTGEEDEDGDMSGLNEEGYRILAEKLAAQTQRQDEGKEGTAEEEPQGKSAEDVQEPAGSVPNSKPTNTGIPSQEEQVLKNSPS